MKLFTCSSTLSVCGILGVLILAQPSEVHCLGIPEVRGGTKKLVAELIQTYNGTVLAEESFLRSHDVAAQMMSEVQEKETVPERQGGAPFAPSSFVQLGSKGPVEEETLWRATYDTQPRRSPPQASVNVFALEDVQREYEEAQMDARESETIRMQREFQLNLKSLRTQLKREKAIRDTVREVAALEEEIKQMRSVKKLCLDNMAGGGNATKVLCPE